MNPTDEAVLAAIRALKPTKHSVNPNMLDIVRKLYGPESLNMETTAAVSISLKELCQQGKVVRHASNPHNRYSIKGED